MDSVCGWIFARVYSVFACYSCVLIQDNSTALMIAVGKGDLTSLRMLLQAGADVMLKNKVMV